MLHSRLISTKGTEKQDTAQHYCLRAPTQKSQQKRTVYRKRMQNTARAEYQAKGNAQIQTEINSIHTINRPTIL